MRRRLQRVGLDVVIRIAKIVREAFVIFGVEGDDPFVMFNAVTHKSCSGEALAVVGRLALAMPNLGLAPHALHLAAVVFGNEAGVLRIDFLQLAPVGKMNGQAAVIAALDHAEIAEGPGGPAAMVPGQHHLRLQMYIAQARDGRFEIVESLGAIDPQERLVGAPALAG